jgi:hypothetical protein
MAITTWRETRVECDWCHDELHFIDEPLVNIKRKARNDGWVLGNEDLCHDCVVAKRVPVC